MRAVVILLVSLSLFAQNRYPLTPKEISEGWLLIYDGESAYGWGLEGGALWATDPDGVLSVRTGESGDMVLSAVFGDYQLTCEMRTPSGRGSGLRVSGVVIPGPREDDKWHYYSVSSSGGHLLASIDGKKVVDQSINEPGTIVLHYRNRDRIAFRNVKLRPTGLAPLFNGKDLTGWREQPQSLWSVKASAIHTDRGPGQIETTAPFKDVVLQADIRTNSRDKNVHPMSGILLRADTKQAGAAYVVRVHNAFKGTDRGQPEELGTGGIVGAQAARRVLGNDNEHVTATILARGRHFSVWVNGIQVNDWDDPNPEGPLVAKAQARLTPGTLGFETYDARANLDIENVRASELK